MSNILRLQNKLISSISPKHFFLERPFISHIFFRNAFFHFEKVWKRVQMGFILFERPFIIFSIFERYWGHPFIYYDILSYTIQWVCKRFSFLKQFWNLSWPLHKAFIFLFKRRLKPTCHCAKLYDIRSILGYTLGNAIADTTDTLKCFVWRTN